MRREFDYDYIYDTEFDVPHRRASTVRGQRQRVAVASAVETSESAPVTAV